MCVLVLHFTNAKFSLCFVIRAAIMSIFSGGDNWLGGVSVKLAALFVGWVSWC